MIPLKPLKQGQTGLVLLTLVGVVAVLHFAEAVLVPVALALLLAFLLAPLVARVQRVGANRAVAVTLTTLVAFALLGVLAYLVAQQFLGLVGDLGSYRSNLIEKVQAITGASNSGISRSVDTVKELTDELQKSAPGKAESPDITKVQIVEPPPNVTQVVRGLFGPLIGPLATAGIVVVFVVFMLLQREDLRDRLVRLLGASEMHNTVRALDDAAERVSRYLLMQLLVNAAQGALVATGLYLIGVPEALLWGALTAVLRFIPYLGPVLAAVGPIILSLAFFPGWAEPMMVIGLILTLELISNNVFEPKLYGTSVGVSSFALVMATVFWTWLWGTAGLFLATPLTVCLVVLGKYIPRLEFLGILLGDQPVLQPGERFYQRLLANDPEEAQELLDEALLDDTLIEVCDSMLLPALRYTEQDHDRGVIDDARRDAILEQAATLIDLAETETNEGAVPDSAAAPESVRRMKVMCLSAADAADELAGRLLARILTPAGIDTQVVGAATLKGEMLTLVENAEPDAIFISAAPPAAVIHARYLCKKLETRFAHTPIVVGLWDAQGDLSKASERLAAVGAGKVVASAAAAFEEMTRLRQSMLQGVRTEPAVPDALVHVSG